MLPVDATARGWEARTLHPDRGMESLAALSAVLEALPLGVFVVDQDDRIVAWNGGAASMFGLAAAEVAGRRFRDLDVSYRVPGLRAAVEAVKSGAEREQLSDVCVRHAEGEMAATVLVTPLAIAGGGRRVMVVAQSHDEVRALSARLRAADDELQARREEAAHAEEELRVANEELHAANDALNSRLRDLEDTQEASRHKDDFLAMLAHELRNPLAPIVSAMHVIRLRPDDGRAVQRAREIVERQVRHQARLLDDLLDVARAARGKIRLRRAPTTLDAVVGSALETTRSRIEARGHEVVVSLPVPPIPIDADGTRLAQAIASVLDNAAKYTASGGRIEVTGAREGGQALLRIRDTGVGIPADMLSRVFDLFTQGEVPLARSQGGLGVGLTLARTLVTMHGGSIEAASEGEGRGSEFTLRLPLAAAGVEARAADAAATGSARSILVVEDNADAREMLRIALELDGHRVEVAEDGVKGVETALRIHPDVALVDIGLPGLDGYEVARRIRQSLGEDVRLVALTGYGQAEDRRRTREAGFDVHLVKPVDPDVLGPLLSDASRHVA
ncbi:MAG TPA: ATP-binding protein [Methylomirabilota bacterium]|nr:ATP-binding protein [Methylomirabilota bacterium]